METVALLLDVELNAKRPSLSVMIGALRGPSNATRACRNGLLSFSSTTRPRMMRWPDGSSDCCAPRIDTVAVINAAVDSSGNAFLNRISDTFACRRDGDDLELIAE